MGGFVEVCAFRHVDAGSVTDLIASYASERGVSATVERAAADHDPDRIDVFAALDGWTVVSWPRLAVGIAMDAARAISERRGAVASCVSIYDGDIWTHLLFDNGRERDRFCSRPDYFEEDPRQVARLFEQWTGDPGAVAAVLEVVPVDIAPYLVPLTDEDYECEADRLAHLDDRFDRRDPWVFVDFWRRLGITYPDPDAHSPAYGLALASGWDTALRTGSQWML